MNQAARKSISANPVLEYGLVVEGRGDELLVEGERGRYWAGRAAGCLLCPEIGDRVLASIDGDGLAYVLSVLERGSVAPNRLQLEGDTILAARGGRLALAGDEEVALAGRRLHLAGEETEVDCERMRLRVSRLESFAGFVRSQFDRMAVFGEAVDGFVGRLTQHLGFHTRYVEEHEEVQAGSLRQVVEGDLHLHAGQAQVIAEDQVKIDGKQIHLG